MQNNFRAEKLKKAKWLLTKNLEIATQREQEDTPKAEKKRTFLEYIKLKLFGL